MILIDTSVWVRAFAGKEPYRSELDRLLAAGRVAGHDLIYGELLMGDRGGSVRSAALALLAQFRWAQPVPHDALVAFVRGRDLAGRGIGWVDAHLLASAVTAAWPLWTADERLAQLAASIGVGWEPL